MLQQQHRKCWSSSTAKSKLLSSSNPINPESTRLHIYHKPLHKNTWLTSAHATAVALPVHKFKHCKIKVKILLKPQSTMNQQGYISITNHCVKTAGSPRPMLPSQQHPMVPSLNHILPTAQALPTAAAFKGSLQHPLNPWNNGVKYPSQTTV